jgi:hypothetical protein
MKNVMSITLLLGEHRQAQLRTAELERKLNYFDQLFATPRYKDYLDRTFTEIELKRRIDYIADNTFPLSLSIELDYLLYP